MEEALMVFRSLRVLLVVSAAGIFALTTLQAQQQAPPSGPPIQIQSPDTQSFQTQPQAQQYHHAEPQQPPQAGQPAATDPEVLTRGPVHEAFATPTTEPMPTTPVAKAPPAALEEMPPDQKPEGDATWI